MPLIARAACLSLATPSDVDVRARYGSREPTIASTSFCASDMRAPRCDTPRIADLALRRRTTFCSNYYRSIKKATTHRAAIALKSISIAKCPSRTKNDTKCELKRTIHLFISVTNRKKILFLLIKKKFFFWFIKSLIDEVSFADLYRVMERKKMRKTVVLIIIKGCLAIIVE